MSIFDTITVPKVGPNGAYDAVILAVLGVIFLTADEQQIGNLRHFTVNSDGRYYVSPNKRGVVVPKDAAYVAVGLLTDKGEVKWHPASVLPVHQSGAVTMPAKSALAGLTFTVETVGQNMRLLLGTPQQQQQQPERQKAVKAAF